MATTRELAQTFQLPPDLAKELFDASKPPPTWPATIEFPIPPLNDLTTDELKLLVAYLRGQWDRHQREEVTRTLDLLDGYLG
jgi:hypothetical protein